MTMPEQTRDDVAQEETEGRLPPMIIAAPDGTIQGRAAINAGSFYINSEAGRYGD